VPVLPAAHLVHFYATPEGLAQSLCGFFAEPLKRGESVIVVAAPEHRRAVDAALREAGVDLAAEIRAGRYRSLDVTETLETLVEEGQISPELFHSRARAMIVEARRRTGAVHVYGELISTLLARGDIVGALQLEDLWAEFLREAPFPLVCGYPREVLDGDLAGVIDGVASIHDAFVTARSTARRASGAVIDLVLGPDASGTARDHVRKVLTTWSHDDADHLDEACLVVSELVGTATRHGSRRAALSVTFDEQGVVVALLDDASHGSPPAEEDLADAGRSFAVIGALAAGWGVERIGGGTRVWARLHRPPVA
jgi:MEDS: MEthanogen/methylotroph, DcmR Sensory domain